MNISQVKELSIPFINIEMYLFGTTISLKVHSHASASEHHPLPCQTTGPTLINETFHVTAQYKKTNIYIHTVRTWPSGEEEKEKEKTLASSSKACTRYRPLF